jgi:hypothetical protein
MHRLVGVLASNQYGGRAEGSAGNEKALTVVEMIMEDLGLDTVNPDGTYRQPYVRGDLNVLRARLVIDASELEQDVEYFVPPLSGSDVVESQVVFAGYGMTVPPFDPARYPKCTLNPDGYDDYASLDVQDKVVLVLSHGFPVADVFYPCPANEAAATDPALYSTGYKAANARLHGARALLVVENYAYEEEALMITTLEYRDPNFPVMQISRTAAERSIPELPQWQETLDRSMSPQSCQLDLRVRMETVTKVDVRVETANVAGAFPGVDPQIGHEVIVVGAHIDSTADPYWVSPGADDNASGVAAMLELARLMARVGRRPDRTVVFVAFNSEETGCAGSYRYVYTLPNMYPAMDTVAMFNLDMVGSGDATRILVAGNIEMERLPLGMLVFNAIHDDRLPYEVVLDEGTTLSDQQYFAEIGVPSALIMTLGVHEHYHQQDDFAHYVKPENMEAAVRVVWAALRRLAFLDAMPDDPVREPMPSAELGGCSAAATGDGRPAVPLFLVPLFVLVILANSRKTRRFRAWG